MEVAISDDCVHIPVNLKYDVTIVPLWYQNSIPNFWKESVSKEGLKMKTHLPLRVLHARSAWDWLNFPNNWVEPVVYHTQLIRICLKAGLRMANAFELHENALNRLSMNGVQLARDRHHGWVNSNGLENALGARWWSS
jgi:hypothetical protein